MKEKQILENVCMEQIDKINWRGSENSVYLICMNRLEFQRSNLNFAVVFFYFCDKTSFTPAGLIFFRIDIKYCRKNLYILKNITFFRNQQKLDLWD